VNLKDPAAQHQEWQQRRVFLTEFGRVNLQRMKAGGCSLCALMLVATPVYFQLNKAELRAFQGLGCLLLFLLMLVVMALFLVGLSFLEKNMDRNVGKIRIVSLAFSVFVLLWSGAFSLLDPFGMGAHAFYMCGMVFASFLIHLPPKIQICSSLVVHVLYLLAFSVTDHGTRYSFGDFSAVHLLDLLAPTAVLGLSLLTASSIYLGRVESFRRRGNSEAKLLELEKRCQELQAVNSELQKRSATDALTGLNNRRMFEEVMAKEWERCKRYSISLSVIMMDVDHFKKYNDHYGHQVGDYCLHQIGALLTRTVRFASDIVARYGGEEFIIALPYTDTEKAAALAERIRSEVERLRIEHEASDVADHVTVSMGVSTVIPLDSNSPDELIYAADMALYEAKEKNRNRIVAVELL